MSLHRWPTLLTLLITSTVCHGASTQPSIDRLLETYRTRYGLPALAAAVVHQGKLVGTGAVGTRKLGAVIPISEADRFHIGSDTKAMTSLLAAMLVEQGKLRWDSTIGEVFPEFADTMEASVKAITLTQLLSHTSGLPGDDETFIDLIGSAMQQGGNLDSMRRWLVQQTVRKPLDAPSGSRFAYSNCGYTLVGAMLEKVTGKTWEELITERLFEPLELYSAGFGCPSSLGKIDAPLGHSDVNGKTESFLAGPNCDNPPVIGPAGTVHLSVIDFARWAGWHAGEGNRAPKLVRPDTLKKLHGVVVRMAAKSDAAPGTPTTGGYALGWGEVGVEWAPYPLLQHAGSNTKNLAQVWVDTRNDLAIVIMTNISRPNTGEGLTKLAAELYRRFSAIREAR